MARPVQMIEKDLSALGGQADALGEQFQETYDAYFQQLGGVLRRQLALAGYQVCTQKYPDAFLQLSLNQQQELQEVLRRLGKEAATKLQPPLGLAESEETSATLATEPADSSTARAESLPESWTDWIEQCEDAIATVLQEATIAANQLLQKYGILPERLPVGAFEIAARAREPGTPNAANLSEITIELRADKEKSEETEVVAAAIVQLRLGDLELTDPTLQSQRRRLQELGRNLGALVKKYQRVTREQAVARAELAWRTSWFDGD